MNEWNAKIIEEFRANEGKVGGPFEGMTLLLLHTIGATDKYSFSTLQPDYPIGYVEPERQPLHPQRFTEIMAGRRAVSESQAEMPASLRNVRLGAVTAREIGWRSSQ